MMIQRSSIKRRHNNTQGKTNHSVCVDGWMMMYVPEWMLIGIVSNDVWWVQKNLGTSLNKNRWLYWYREAASLMDGWCRFNFMMWGQSCCVVCLFLRFRCFDVCPFVAVGRINAGMKLLGVVKFCMSSLMSFMIMYIITISKTWALPKMTFVKIN